jgi:hypothetical protein
MKKARPKRRRADIRPEYDFSKGVRGKYAGRIARTSTVIVLEPDVAQVFDTSESVNSALRALAAIPRPKKRKRVG